MKPKFNIDDVKQLSFCANPKCKDYILMFKTDLPNLLPKHPNFYEHYEKFLQDKDWHVVDKDDIKPMSKSKETVYKTTENSPLGNKIVLCPICFFKFKKPA